MKKVKNSILILSLFVFSKMFSQEAPEVRFSTMDDQILTEEVAYEYLLANHVRLRKGPSISSKKITTLDIGTKMKVLEQSKNTEEINGIKSSWYKVRIEDKEDGWIWGGFIAQNSFGSITNSEIKFVFGYENTGENEAGEFEENYQIRAFKNGVQLDKIVFKSSTISYWQVKNIGNKGIYNVEDIINLYIPCNVAYGCESGDSYIFWNNNKFFYVADLLDCENGEFSESESLVFPSDMDGEKGVIIKKTSKVVDMRMQESDSTTIKREVIKTYYKWVGNKLVQTNKAPSVLNYMVVSN
ncbi:MAG: SH3 domain-containing protein [Cellulophaga sp.]